ncbi:MAG: sugar phosphate isomerase/epimerase [Bryobacterales bacterium]|nr:sugar phosphate isomerase/epimerase [Bryobacterales bacterium]
MQRRHLLQALAAAPLATSLQAAGSPAKARFRSAICAYSYRQALAAKKMTYEDLVHLSVEMNVDGLDLTVYWFPSPNDDFLLPLKRAAYKAGVEIYSISVRTDMCRPPTEQAGEIEKIREWVDVAARLGAGHIRVFGGRVPDGATENQAAIWCAEVLKRSGDYAGSKGVILGLENHGGITERAERIIEIVKRVDSPWVGVNLDSGNFRSDAFRQIEMCIPYAVNVQLKAEMRSEAGQVERQDWNRLIGLLAKGNYKGYVALEYEAKEAAETAVPRLIKEMQSILNRHTA